MILEGEVLRRFIPIDLAGAVRADLRHADGGPLVTAAPYLPGYQLEVPAISYGVTNLEGLKLRQTPDDTAQASVAPIHPLPCYTIRDALVHGRGGFVTTGGYIITDFLSHVPLYRLPGVGPTEDGGWRFLAPSPRLRLGEALHLAAANVDNYFHWNIDALARFDPAMLHNASGAARPLLISQPHAVWQQQGLDLLPVADHPVLRLDDRAVIAVDRLVSVPSLSGGGFFVHPAALRPFQAWRERLGPLPDGPKSIYVSRQDSGQRLLVNEPAVIEMVTAAGFQVVSLTGMPVAEQVQLFAGARRVIGPHGAGLTNLVFCRPGARVLELHMDGYVQWAFRRLAGLAGLQYGCVIGTTNEAWHDWAHLNSWTIDIDQLRSVLEVF